MTRAAVTAVIGCLLALGVGCGPVEYVNQVTRKASSEVAAARSVDAEKWAPYYYMRATLYLHKAREEASRADYQAANRFGRIAHGDAVKAKELSIERSAKGELPGPIESPAKTEPTPEKQPPDDQARDEAEDIEDAPEAEST